MSTDSPNESEGRLSVWLCPVCGESGKSSSKVQSEIDVMEHAMSKHGVSMEQVRTIKADNPIEAVGQALFHMLRRQIEIYALSPQLFPPKAIMAALAEFHAETVPFLLSQTQLTLYGFTPEDQDEKTPSV